MKFNHKTSRSNSTTIPLFSHIYQVCTMLLVSCYYHYFFFHTFTFQLLDKPWSQVSPLLPPGSYLQILSRTGFSNSTARRFFIECCSLSKFVPKKKSSRVYTSMHSERLELTKLTYTRLKDNLIRHRGDRHYTRYQVARPS